MHPLINIWHPKTAPTVCLHDHHEGEMRREPPRLSCSSQHYHATSAASAARPPYSPLLSVLVPSQILLHPPDEGRAGGGDGGRTGLAFAFLTLTAPGPPGGWVHVHFMWGEHVKNLVANETTKEQNATEF